MMWWWVLIHVLAILGQLGVFVVGIASFVFSRPGDFGDHFPSHEEFWDDVETKSTLPWAASALGAATALISIVLFIVLWTADRANESRQSTALSCRFRNVVMISSVIISLVVVADVGLAVKSGISDKIGICAAAAIGGGFSILTVCADQLKLRMHYRKQERHNYAMEHVRGSEEGLISPSVPPSYEVAIGESRK
ncbi:hypothetical protein F4779DRAFT_571466 [Xylariaceae sp. FL0662B]|nr:hypothetical protein F4779DRAFT_571466 [Xylariaceae sp. FL0662B]